MAASMILKLLKHQRGLVVFLPKFIRVCGTWTFCWYSWVLYNKLPFYWIHPTETIPLLDVHLEHIPFQRIIRHIFMYTFWILIILQETFLLLSLFFCQQKDISKCEVYNIDFNSQILQITSKMIFKLSKFHTRHVSSHCFFAHHDLRAMWKDYIAKK